MAQPETLKTKPAARNGATKKNGVKAPLKPKEWIGSIHHAPVPMCVPTGLVSCVSEIEAHFQKPVWLLVQTRTARVDGPGPFESLDEHVWQAIYKHKGLLPRSGIVLLLESPGGQARIAYRIARLLNETCGEVITLIPRWSKSAATLLALGTDRVIVSGLGELGPLDAQLTDTEREEVTSSLDDYQALQRLMARGLEAVDEAMYMLLSRTGKKVETLLPMTMHFIADMMKPLMEKFDVVHYSQMARIMKVAEEYLSRLLAERYGAEPAKKIARALVENYPEHQFVIDPAEASSLGLTHVEAADSTVMAIMDRIAYELDHYVVIGPLKEYTS